MKKRFFTKAFGLCALAMLPALWATKAQAVLILTNIADTQVLLLAGLSWQPDTLGVASKPNIDDTYKSSFTHWDVRVGFKDTNSNGVVDWAVDEFTLEVFHIGAPHSGDSPTGPTWRMTGPLPVLDAPIQTAGEPMPHGGEPDHGDSFSISFEAFGIPGLGEFGKGNITAKHTLEPAVGQP